MRKYAAVLYMLIVTFFSLFFFSYVFAWVLKKIIRFFPYNLFKGKCSKVPRQKKKITGQKRWV